MSKGEISPPAKKATDFSAFRASGGFGFWVLEVADWSARGSVCGTMDEVGIHTGVGGGEENFGIGSKVDTAGAPVSPRMSAPSPLDFRRGRAMLCFGVRRSLLDLDRLRKCAFEGDLNLNESSDKVACVMRFICKSGSTLTPLWANLVAERSLSNHSTSRLAHLYGVE